MKIKLFLTGGTIDKSYDELQATLGFSAGSYITAMLDQSRSTLDIDSETLMLLDSLDVTDDKRQEILAAVIKTSENKIVITHGTDTMPQTAALLGQNIHDKTIILTGSMIPFSLGNSDALFNLGGALAAVQLLDTGVYVVMNGKIFSWDNVRKNKQEGRFEADS